MSTLPTEGKHAYRLDRTGRNIVSARPPVHQSNPKTTIGQSGFRKAVMEGRHIATAKSTMTAVNVDVRSKYSGKFSINRENVKVGA